MLPNRWYLKPRELFEITKIGVHLLTNIVVTSLPLKLTESVMSMLNPDLRQRVKIRDYDPDTYEQIDWEKVVPRIVERSGLLLPRPTLHRDASRPIVEASPGP